MLLWCPKHSVTYACGRSEFRCLQYWIPWIHFIFVMFENNTFKFATCFDKNILKDVLDGSESWKYNLYFPVAEGARNIYIWFYLKYCWTNLVPTSDWLSTGIIMLLNMWNLISCWAGFVLNELTIKAFLFYISGFSLDLYI